MAHNELELMSNDYQALLKRAFHLKSENERLTAEVTALKEIEAAALEAHYLNGYHTGACMCANCLLQKVLSERSTMYASDQRLVQFLAEPVSGSEES